jgi:hypothetical protein
MKWLMILIYLLLVATGAVAIVLRSQKSLEVTAAKDLPANHRLADSDLLAPATSWTLARSVPDASKYTGRYLNHGVKSGEVVQIASLQPHPTIKAKEGTEAFPWFLHDADQRWQTILDVGWRVDLCAETCPAMDAPVLALDCDSPNSSNCAAELQLTRAQRDSLLSYSPKNKLTLAISKPALGETQ